MSWQRTRLSMPRPKLSPRPARAHSDRPRTQTRGSTLRSLTRSRRSARDVIGDRRRLFADAIEDARLSPVKEMHAEEVEAARVRVVRPLDGIPGWVERGRLHPRVVIPVTRGPEHC